MQYVDVAWFKKDEFSLHVKITTTYLVLWKLEMFLWKAAIFIKNFGSVSACIFAISAETPKLTEMPISAETETEISVGH